MAEHWKFLAGVRYDHADVIFDRSFTLTFVARTFRRANAEDFDVGTPRFGLIYEPLPEKLSFYAMYARRSIRPTAGPISRPRRSTRFGRAGKAASR